MNQTKRAPSRYDTPILPSEQYLIIDSRFGTEQSPILPSEQFSRDQQGRWPTRACGHEGCPKQATFGFRCDAHQGDKNSVFGGLERKSSLLGWIKSILGKK